jgi:phage baseplate assembly protein W
MMRHPPQARDFLGQGLAFPLAVTPGGRLAAARFESKIAHSIEMILGTARGERLMRPDFGCGVHELPFTANDDASIGRVTDEVGQALARFEPRIDVLDVSAELADEHPNILLIRIDYRIRQNNAVTNLVYPFFVQEGF